MLSTARRRFSTALDAWIAPPKSLALALADTLTPGPETPRRPLHHPPNTRRVPPEPFTRRMWASGTMRWNTKPGGALRVGDNAAPTIASVKKKGFDAESTHPMLSVKQRIKITAQGREGSSIVEERSHVYLASGGNRRDARQGVSLFVMAGRTD